MEEAFMVGRGRRFVCVGGVTCLDTVVMGTLFRWVECGFIEAGTTEDWGGMLELVEFFGCVLPRG